MIQHKANSQFTKTIFGILAVVLGLVPLQARADNNTERITESGHVFHEIMTSHPGIPQNLLNTAECIIILPGVKKAGLAIGAQYGKGVMSCRSGENFDGKWCAPIMFHSTGGSFGLQIGAQSTDFVVLVMNDGGARTLLKGKVKLGADASVAAGPVGRDAEASTSGNMSAQMLSYSRAKGVFGGLALNGTTLGPDDEDNEKVYGKKVSGQEIFSGSVPAPTEATALLSELETASPKNLSKGKAGQ